MKHMLSAPEIYLYRESVDFRKSINGLAAIIESETDLPLGSGVFLFTQPYVSLREDSVHRYEEAALAKSQSLF